MKASCKIILIGDKDYAYNFIGAAQSQLRILENQMSFQNLKQGVRRVRFNSRATIEALVCFNLREVKIHCLPAITRRVKKEFEKLSKKYVYVTISDFVTIWDLLTGEVAEDVCDNNGNINDGEGNPSITFPCHRDELVKWLEGVPDKPTRQVLKDGSENNRDYMLDNKIDIGNENRVEVANEFDPSFDCYFGIADPPYFTEIVQDNSFNECDPRCCDTQDCEVVLNCERGHVIEKNVATINRIINCDPEKCADSFSCDWGKTYLYDCQMHQYYRPFKRCRGCNRYHTHNNEMKYLKTSHNRTKHLYLGSYPSPVFLIPGSSSEYRHYTIKGGSPYREPVDIETDCTIFACSDWLSGVNGNLKKAARNGKSFSIRTKLGDLLLDHIPKREWKDGEMLYEIMKKATLEGMCFSTKLKEGISTSSSEWEATLDMWRDYIHAPTVVDGPEHATDTHNWCRAETRNSIDRIKSESNRTGVTWCGSPDPIDKLDEQGKIIKKAKKRNWNRILLRFYMGGFHTSGREVMQNWNFSPYYCPNEEMCEALVEQHGGAGAECTSTSWSDELVERFSSVQATIELEKPKSYSKKKDSIRRKGKAVSRYKRPDEYDEHKEEFTSLCAFPGRECGTEEDKGKNICYPFDGTYDIYTLGEAIEELINGHYEDGSDDQLLVYLYERPNMIEKEKEEK